MLTKDQCKLNMIIENHDKYPGEGKSKIVNIDEHEITAKKIKCPKYPELVGQHFIISNYELKYFIKSK